MTAVAPPPVSPELERAKADYLAISRNAHLYASPEAHAQAEQAAWERLQNAVAAAATDGGDET